MEVSELLQQIDAVEFIGRYVDLEERGGEFWGLSPFKEENTPSFSVRRDNGDGIGVFKDFSSGIAGNCLTFVRYYFHKNSNDALQFLYNIYNENDDKTVVLKERMNATKICRKYSKKTQVKELSKMNILPNDYMSRYLYDSDKLDVWRKEGITDEALKFFGVMYDDFSNHIVYPIRDLSGNIVNVGARTLDPLYKEHGVRKYTYFKQWGGKMSIVYGLFENMSEIQKKREVIIFEGAKSVMISRGYGYKNCGAILTSHLNPAQMMVLAKLGCTVVFALDKEVRISDDYNIKKLRRYVNVEYIYDVYDLIGEKDSPVDKGKDVFNKLYSERLVMR